MRKETMRNYRIYQVDAFTTELFAGNPAGVVPDAEGLTDVQMQKIAREMNLSETAFVFPPDGSDHDVRVRFFTPVTEVPACGHATVAAHYVRAIENELPSCTVVQKIGAGILPVEVVPDDEDYRIVLTQGPPEFRLPFDETLAAEIVQALGLTPEDRDPRCPIQIVSTGYAKVLVGIRSRGILNAIKPDIAHLINLSARINCTGYYVFVLTEDSEILAYGRMFAPAIGVNEDPVTGNANGCLGAYLVKHRLAAPVGGRLEFRVAQGESMGRRGVMEVLVDGEPGHPMRVRLGGRAVVVVRGELMLRSPQRPIDRVAHRDRELQRDASRAKESAHLRERIRAIAT